MPMITMRDAAMPGRREPAHPALLSAGFRPFFLLAAIWAAIGVPVWLAAYVHGYATRGSLPAMLWHSHEMVFGYALATVAGFLLTAIPNWTGRLPIRGLPLGLLALLWITGRAALLGSAAIGSGAAAVLDLSFTALLIGFVARELIAGRNWRNLPMVLALSFLLAGNILVHLQALGIAHTADLGIRIGLATLLALISLVGGRIVPGFTRNWLAKERRDVPAPAQIGRLDHACMAVTVVGIVGWVVAPDSVVASILEILAGIAVALRLSRWRGLATVREPLLVVLHVGYAWLAIGFLLVGLNGFLDLMPRGGALHALTVGAVGTMTLAVMTRASLGHSGRPLAAGFGTLSIYLLVTLAAILRVLAPVSGDYVLWLTSLSGVAWSAAFGLFALLYGPMLLRYKR